MSRTAQWIKNVDFPLNPGTFFFLATFSMSAMSPGLDIPVQIYALVATIGLLELVVVESIQPASAWPVHVILLAIIFFVLVVLGILGFPAKGNWATGLHWHAVIITTFVVSIILASAFSRRPVVEWETPSVVKFYAVLLSVDAFLMAVLWVLFP